MSPQRYALKFGLQLVQTKLGEAAGDPNFNVLGEQAPEALPTSARQIKDKSVKIQPPRVVTTR
jgi:hypothetical protein